MAGDDAALTVAAGVLSLGLLFQIAWLSVRVALDERRSQRASSLEDEIFATLLDELQPDQRSAALAKYPRWLLRDVMLSVAARTAGDFRETIQSEYRALGLIEDDLRAIESSSTLQQIKGARRIAVMADAKVASRIAHQWPDSHVARISLLLALSRIDLPNALIAYLRRWPPVDDLSSTALKSILQQTSARSCSYLMDYLHLVAEPSIRCLILSEAVAKCPEQREPWMRIAFHAVNAQYRETACDLCRRWGLSAYVDELSRLLEDADVRVRARAAAALGRLGGPEHAPLLARVVTRQGFEAQRAAAHALFELGEGGRRLLTDLHRDHPHPDIRSIAQEALHVRSLETKAA